MPFSFNCLKNLNFYNLKFETKKNFAITTNKKGLTSVGPKRNLTRPASLVLADHVREYQKNHGKGNQCRPCQGPCRVGRRETKLQAPPIWCRPPNTGGDYQKNPNPQHPSLEAGNRKLGQSPPGHCGAGGEKKQN